MQTAGLQFANNGRTLVKGVNCNKVYPYIQCRNCSQFGHYANCCPSDNKKEEENVQLMMEGGILDDESLAFNFVAAQYHDGFSLMRDYSTNQLACHHIQLSFLQLKRTTLKIALLPLPM